MRADGGEETESRQKTGSESTARRCSKIEVYWIWSYPRPKDQDTIKPYKRPTAEAPGEEATCRTVEYDRLAHESLFELPQQRPSCLKPPVVWSQPKVGHCPAHAEFRLVEGRSSCIEVQAAEIPTVTAHSISRNLCGSRFVS
jgi:hypothetical protein